jgi:hypothetical protein
LSSRPALRVSEKKEAAMNMVFLIIVLTFVISVLGMVGFVIFQISPFAHHNDHYRDPETGKRRFESPRLD